MDPSSLNVDQLKAELRSRKLQLSGRKPVLVARRLLGPVWGGVAQGASIGSPKVPRGLHALLRSPVPLLWFIVNRTKRHNPINYSKDRSTRRVSGYVLARFPGSPVRRSKRF